MSNPNIIPGMFNILQNLECNMSFPEISSENLSRFIKEEALRLGFDACGFAAIGEVRERHAGKYRNWIEKGLNGKMHYMANYGDMRLNPALLVPEAVSVISLAMNYYQERFQPADTKYKVSCYATGIDYHFVIKSKLRKLLDAIQQKTQVIHSRIFTDSAPVLERSWAQEAGLGAPGKNTCLIIPGKGSFYFLSEIFIDSPLVYDAPFEKDLCGKCTRCIDACPTQALKGDGSMDARRCISYLTIELKDDIPAEFKGKANGYIFGCDICQLVCPHNQKFSQPTPIDEFHPFPAISGWSNHDWETIDKARFKDSFVKKSSAISRVRFEKMQLNIAWAQ